MLDERPEAMATTPAAAPAPASCGVVLENVTVKWPASADEEENTLTDVSLRVGPGQTLAVVGHVGAGKVNLFLLEAFEIFISIIGRHLNLRQKTEYFL